MKRAGTPILAGTDGPYSQGGDALHCELELLVQAGLTPHQGWGLSRAQTQGEQVTARLRRQFAGFSSGLPVNLQRSIENYNGLPTVHNRVFE
jgi:hypothetical protein